MKKGLKTLIAGILLLVVGPFIFPIVFMIPVLLEVIQGDPNEKQFIIPGAAEIKVTEAGRYYLWNDYKTIHEGKSYSRSKNIPDGLEINVTDQEGKSLSLTSDTLVTSARGSSAKNSIGYVEVTSPTKLTVMVSGNSDQRVFSFSTSFIMRMLGRFFAGLGLSMLFPAAGIAISIWGVVKLLKGKKPGAADNLPSLRQVQP